MRVPLCVVFSDAFAYETYSNLSGLGAKFNKYLIKPGIGYSSNLHYLLFDGKSPDEVGFFTDYSWHQAKEPKCNKLQNICDQIETVNNIVRVARRVILKKTDNIPFEEQTFFAPKGKYKFMEDGECLVFGQNCDKAYIVDTRKCFSHAKEMLKNGSDSIVVVLEELDHLGHEVGAHDERYINAAKKIIQNTNDLFEEFVEKYPDAVCILISDHGMSDVVATVNIWNTIRNKFGPSGDRYQFYNDSIYLRVWSEDKALLSEIREYLGSISILLEISENDKLAYGVTSKSAGDIIFRLAEGYAFSPNCFGVSVRGGSKGLHGYMERTGSASGIIAINRVLCDKSEIDARDVYCTVQRILESQGDIENSVHA